MAVMPKSAETLDTKSLKVKAMALRAPKTKMTNTEPKSSKTLRRSWAVSNETEMGLRALKSPATNTRVLEGPARSLRDLESTAETLRILKKDYFKT